MNQPCRAIRAWLVHHLLAVPVGVALYRRRSRAQGRKQIPAVLEQLVRQRAVDERLRAELDLGSHSLERPLVVLNPYGDSPLVAVAIFQTDGPSQISISVHGVDAASGVDFAFDGYRTKHLIPVYGLYADTENEVLLCATDQSGRVQRSTSKIRTEALPSGLGEVRVDILKSDTARSQSGFTFLYRSTPKFAFDANGDIRWFLDLPTNETTLYDFRGHMVLTSGDILGEALLYEADFLGRLYSIGLTPYGAHHDVEEVGSGKLLVTGSGTGRTIYDLLYEFNPDTGETGVVLDFKSILDSTCPSIGRTRLDWLHMNALTWSKNDSSIIVSCRNQSAVVKVSYPEGRIKWILGNHDNWLPEYAKYLLTPKGENFEWQYSQHAPAILPDQDNNPDTVDIILFDNHSFFDERPEVIPEPRYSRLVHYRVDEKAKTIEQIWQFGKERGNELFSYHRGVADYLPNGCTLGLFSLTRGHRTRYSRIIELRHDTREVVFDAVVYSSTRRSLDDYRCARLDFYSPSDNDYYKLKPCKENIPPDMRQGRNTP
jgi:arylsulfate sulfotransferase